MSEQAEAPHVIVDAVLAVLHAALSTGRIARPASADIEATRAHPMAGTFAIDSADVLRAVQGHWEGQRSDQESVPRVIWRFGLSA